MYQQIEAQNSSDMIEPTKMSNYTIDGEPSAEGTRRLIQPETGDIVHQKEIFVIHDNKIYFLFLEVMPLKWLSPKRRKYLTI